VTGGAAAVSDWTEPATPAQVRDHQRQYDFAQLKERGEQPSREKIDRWAWAFEERMKGYPIVQPSIQLAYDNGASSHYGGDWCGFQNTGDGAGGAQLYGGLHPSLVGGMGRQLERHPSLQPMQPPPPPQPPLPPLPLQPPLPRPRRGTGRPPVMRRGSWRPFRRLRG
jgi:hypothetical protein